MRIITLVTLTAIAATLTLNDAAEARRMGGGGNFGAQRQSVTPQRASPAQANPAAPAAPGNATTPASPQSPASAAAPKTPPPSAQPAPSGMSRWMGPLAGIAAGLGLAALLSHFGLSEGFGSLLVLAFIVLGGVFLVRTFLGRRAPASAPLRYAGDAGDASGDAFAQARPSSTTPTWHIPSNLDLEAAPAAAAPAAAAFGIQRHPLPPGFDAAGFAREAKRQYIEIQRAYDAADRNALADVMTSTMAEQIGHELDTRGTHHPTEIVKLDAEVLEVASEGDQHWASVRFTGLVKEDGDPVPHAIDEVWNLSKPVSGGSGWLLAGISQLA
jgi:predicted lipid-binding transport protein (Tim44 family)